MLFRSFISNAIINIFFLEKNVSRNGLLYRPEFTHLTSNNSSFVPGDTFPDQPEGCLNNGNLRLDKLVYHGGWGVLIDL